MSVEAHYGEESCSDGAIYGVRLFLCKACEMEGVAQFWDQALGDGLSRFSFG